MHCPELQGREDKFTIVAACDLIPERRERMARKYGCRTYARIEDLIADPQVEVVDVATRSSEHFPHAMLALRAGKIVFLEKPMCRIYAEARQLRRASASGMGRLYVRHNRRYEPAFQHIREIIASGILGEVFEIKLRRVSYGRRDDWQTLQQFGGGQLLNWGPHLIDHGLRLLESPLKLLWSDLKQVAATGDCEDHVKLIMTGRNGRIVDVEISGGVAIGCPEWLVWGARGSLVCDGNSITLKYLDPRRRLLPRQADPGTPGETFGHPDKLHWIEKTIPVKPRLAVNMTTIWDDLYRSIRQGARFPIALDEAVEVMRVVSLAKKTGKRIEMPYNYWKEKDHHESSGHQEAGCD
jgi:predicted dehydrogenase